MGSMRWTGSTASAMNRLKPCEIYRGRAFLAAAPRTAADHGVSADGSFLELQRAFLIGASHQKLTARRSLAIAAHCELTAVILYKEYGRQEVRRLQPDPGYHPQLVRDSGERRAGTAESLEGPD